eukprot:GHVU01158851.1.p1 GENE.GHVU01158851.1~~GHVU01158851.1.p1  ORF type:complete len:164 (-),score=9.29 GHVU01158851.1:47-538(-)
MRVRLRGYHRSCASALARVIGSRSARLYVCIDSHTTRVLCKCEGKCVGYSVYDDVCIVVCDGKRFAVTLPANYALLETARWYPTRAIVSSPPHLHALGRKPLFFVPLPMRQHLLLLLLLLVPSAASNGWKLEQPPGQHPLPVAAAAAAARRTFPTHTHHGVSI